MLGLIAVAFTQLQLQLAGPPLARIGVADGDTLQTLYNVTRVYQDTRGHVYVFQFGLPYVAVFDSTGRRSATLGRGGGGPGEFSMPNSASFLADSIWIADAALGKFAVFGPDFEHVRDEFVRHSLPTIGGEIGLSPLEVLPDGSFLVTVVDSGTTYFWVDKRGLRAELLRVPESAYRAGVVVGGRVRSYMGKPISAWPYLIHDGHRFFVIDRSRADGLRVSQVLSDLQAIVVPLEAHPVGDREIELALRPFVERVKRDYPSLSTGSIRAAFVEALDAPSMNYYLDGFLYEPNRTLWLSQNLPHIDGSRLLKVDLLDGRIVAYIDVPDGQKVMAIDGSSAWILEPDSDDVPFLTRYKLMSK